MTFPKDRVPYSAIIDRPPLALPGGARMIIWTIVNVEEWDIERPMPRSVLSPPMGQPLMPDLPNWAWHEYGMRVGFWRLLDCLKRFEIPDTLAINGSGDVYKRQDYRRNSFLYRPCPKGVGKPWSNRNI